MAVSKRQGYKHALYKMWHLAYIDKNVFGQDKLQLNQNDLLKLCKDQAPNQGMYVLPRKPTRPLSPTNAVLVGKLQRRYLLALWKLTKDEEAYGDCINDL